MYGLTRGEKASLQEIVDVWVKMDESTRVIPLPQNSAHYQELQKIHDQLSLALRPVFKTHRTLINKGKKILDTQ
jgi:hypothetical protein